MDFSNSARKNSGCCGPKIQIWVFVEKFCGELFIKKLDLERKKSASFITTDTSLFSLLLCTSVFLRKELGFYGKTSSSSCQDCSVHVNRNYREFSKQEELSKLSGISSAYVAKLPPMLGLQEKISRKIFERSLQHMKKTYFDGFVTTAFYVSTEAFREKFAEKSVFELEILSWSCRYSFLNVRMNNYEVFKIYLENYCVFSLNVSAALVKIDFCKSAVSFSGDFHWRVFTFRTLV